MCSVIIPFCMRLRDKAGVLQRVVRYAVINLSDDPCDTYYTILDTEPIAREGIEERESERVVTSNDTLRVYIGDVIVDLARIDPTNARDCKIIIQTLQAYLSYPEIKPEVTRMSRAVIEYLEGVSE